MRLIPLYNLDKTMSILAVLIVGNVRFYLVFLLKMSVFSLICPQAFGGTAVVFLCK